jgi:glutaredoxin
LIHRAWPLVVLAIGGCRRRAEPIDAAPISVTQELRADDEIEVLFVDLGGAVRRAASVAMVPQASRHVVGVDSPNGLYLADVSVPAPSWTAYRGTLDELERRGLAALPAGPSANAVLPAVDPTVDPPPPPDGVVVYGSTWCDPCTETRAWLDARGVAYAYRNVEQDGAAATDVSALCAALDVPACRIPVIDLAGKVVVGFDPARLATILGESI